jgi:hypothetical protein
MFTLMVLLETTKHVTKSINIVYGTMNVFMLMVLLVMFLLNLVFSIEIYFEIKYYFFSKNINLIIIIIISSCLFIRKIC